MAGRNTRATAAAMARGGRVVCARTGSPPEMRSTELAQLMLRFIFLASARAKWWRPRGAVRAVRAYRVVPERFVTPAAVFVIASETLVAAMLLSGIASRPGLVAAAGLMIGFSGVLAATRMRRGDVSCGCLGAVVDLQPTRFALVANLAIAG